MELNTFFFDTYAFYEIIKGNSNYRPYSKGIAIITTKLNLMELYYGLLSNYGIETAEKHFQRFSKFCVEFTDENIKNAMQFKAKNKEKKLSYIDCIGYIIAIEKNIPFLTGDKQFKLLGNVEFVK
ncbi:PIN domain-containing protein [Candidatus Micrarchaeota archaeon]|nr:PIN domain-containing protein [Candidatus Micrarchaeota archaeon]MBU2477037.1 PIN domain-containing protein [Candidatus Micrarchaeota archaeon]